MQRRTSYSIMARVPVSLRGAVEKASARSFITPAALVRQALCEKLEREGLLSLDDSDTRRLASGVREDAA